MTSDTITADAAREWREENEQREQRPKSRRPSRDGERQPEAPLPDVAPSGPGEAVKPVSFAPSRYVFRDPAQIPRRQFLYGRHLIRGFVSATVAPGGIGKSSLALVEAVAMAAGLDILGVRPVAQLRVWYANLEDPREEIERRIAAICKHFRIKPEDLGDRLCIDGRDTCEIILAMQTNSGAAITKPVVDGLTAALKAGRFDVLTIDPFVSAHRVTENDNGAIDAVVKALGRMAGATGIAIELIHHVRKTGGADATAEDARGAGATVAAARSVRVLNRMSEGDAEKAGLDDEARRRTFRLQDDKANLAPPEKAGWFQMQSVPLGNGSGGDNSDQDFVGVVVAWNWPSALEGVSVADLRAVQAKVAAGSFRENPQAADWVGNAVAEVLRLDANEKASRAKINGLVKTWTANRMFKTVSRPDEKRMLRKFVEVDEWAND